MRCHRLRILSVPGIVAGLAVTVSVTPAVAQTALGSGNALDRNLDPRTGGVNQPVTEIDFNQRNLLITNNVLGGRGFRESVGYTSPDSFRESTGSDELFDFRADSAWSTVNFMNYGNTYQRLRFGQDLGLSYRRATDGVTPSALDQAFERPSQRIEAELRLDSVSEASSTAGTARLQVEPQVVGTFTDQEGHGQVIQTSALAGVTTTPVSQLGQIIGLTTYDFARLGEDARAGNVEGIRSVGRPFASQYSDLRAGTDARREIEPVVEHADGALAVEGLRVGHETEEEPNRPAFERIRERVAERAARIQRLGRGDELLATLDEEMTALREDLSGAGTAGDDVLEPMMPGPDERERTRAITPFTDQPDAGEEGEEGEEEARTPRRRLEDFGMILRHGQRIDQLASPDQTRFNELMRTAEERLRAGEYFWAERRFIRALRFQPGNPMATVGLVHAQIGAGLYTAASITLRGLFVNQPEMIDARFGERLLPNRPRLLAATQTLRHRLEILDDRTAAAFMLAYVGRLLGDRALVVEGLAIMHESAPRDPLVPLLEAVWLAEEEADADAPPRRFGADAGAGDGTSEP